MFSGRLPDFADPSGVMLRRVMVEIGKVAPDQMGRLVQAGSTRGLGLDR